MESTQPANAYAILKALRHPDGTSMFTPSSVYREIARLTDLGYLEQDEVVTSRGRLVTYVPSMKAVEAVQSWVRTPADLPIQVSTEAWLRIASTRSCRPRDVLHGLSTLTDELDERLDELELQARIARRNGSWGMASELEYALEREALDACRRWAVVATHLLETKVKALSDEPSRK